ncbi:MAG: hypothetical protein IJN92_01270 [Lachnospiraceae bacterium]|nr:hypothetical protein [Lachnospiraceae bacterium]
MKHSNTHNIYIVLSQTETGFARVLRTVGNLNYNHAAISLDKDLKELYAFARTEQYGYLTARLVRETTDRYLINAQDGIPILVYQIPVTKKQLNWVRSTINEIMVDPKYMYNLFSVLTYPIFGGFTTYKAFSCIEFVAYILDHLGYDIGDSLPQCRPDDLRSILADYLYFDGNLLDYISERTTSENYFRPLTVSLMCSTVIATIVLLYRSIPALLHFIRNKTKIEFPI